MATIYLVTSGDYSDYGVDAVFDDAELADQYMRAFPPSGYVGYNDLTEMELNPFTVQLRAGFVGYAVHMHHDGQVTEVTRTAHTPDGVPWPGWANQRIFHVMARDEQHAIKIANDRRAEMIARGEWP